VVPFAQNYWAAYKPQVQVLEKYKEKGITFFKGRYNFNLPLFVDIFFKLKIDFHNSI